MLKKAFKAALIIIGVIGIWHIYLIFTLASADIIVKKRSSSGMIFSNVYYYAIQNNRAIPVSEPMLTAVGKKNVRSESYYSKDAVPCYCVGDLLHGETVCYTKSQLELKAHPIRTESPELTAEDRQNIKSIADYTEELFPEMCDNYVVFYYIPHDGDVGAAQNESDFRRELVDHFLHLGIQFSLFARGGIVGVFIHANEHFPVNTI